MMMLFGDAFAFFRFDAFLDFAALDQIGVFGHLTLMFDYKIKKIIFHDITFFIDVFIIEQL